MAQVEVGTGSDLGSDRSVGDERMDFRCALTVELMELGVAARMGQLLGWGGSQD